MTTTTEQAKADIDRDPMWHRAYMDVQAVLDKALGTEEADGMGQGIASDVWLLAHQRDEARAKLAEVRALAADWVATSAPAGEWEPSRTDELLGSCGRAVLAITGTGEEAHHA